jgi:transcriptional regulator with XRE-family HTH domain
MSEIKDRLSEERKKLNWTQEDLAEKSGVSRAVIAKIENGTTKQPGIKNMIKIAKALDTRPGYLLFGEPNLSEDALNLATMMQSLSQETRSALINLINSIKEN